MGKGDRRSKRGKIFRGTFGKRRPKPKGAPKGGKPAGGLRDCLDRVAIRLAGITVLRLRSASRTAENRYSTDRAPAGWPINYDSRWTANESPKQREGVLLSWRNFGFSRRDTAISRWRSGIRIDPRRWLVAESAFAEHFTAGRLAFRLDGPGAHHADPPVREIGPGDPDRAGDPGRQQRLRSERLLGFAHDPDRISAMGDRGPGRPQPRR